jgi:type II secretory pathway component GspD/PulD (secretin)
MKPARPFFFGAVLLLSTLAANAQVPPSGDRAPPGSVPISSLVAMVAKNTGRKFVLDPRVRAEVTLMGEEPSSVTYDELLTILDTYGFTTVDTGGYIQVIPDAMMRSEPLPIVTGNDKRADEYVTTVIHVRSLSAAELVPILRPMVPQQGHLAALPCSNDLVMVERFANVRRIEAVIKAMDTGADQDAELRLHDAGSPLASARSAHAGPGFPPPRSLARA